MAKDIAPPAWIQELPVLGVGVGFRKALQRAILTSRTAIDFLEIILDQYIEPAGAQRRELRQLRRLYPVIPHGLGLSLGSVDPPDASYVDHVAAVIARVQPPWWSEHLAMTRAGPLDIGHLAPLPFTEEMVDVICQNIARITRRIPVPLILENIAYTHAFAGNTLTEAAFVTSVLEQSDCGLLLDVMNLYANSQNHGYDPFEFLEQIPLERVVQVHTIGGHWEQGILVDSHSAATPPAVWELLRYVAHRTPLKAILVEWDEHFPSFDTILRELAKARAILHHAQCPTVTSEVAHAVS